jgi:hypothetical protein
VGQGRVELPTSRLSGVRSNHLSYWPVQNSALRLLGHFHLVLAPHEIADGGQWAALALAVSEVASAADCAAPRSLETESYAADCGS